ncbi:hypothetical protein [Hymenobacter metallilatus]|uniref:Uncharacterized protein n=1 Tax=Hymenobacter metallilatus TaxID=2493666 RepID=A0A428JET4_9BACT|nr:hypothetical protein [Hymenobacter metallilatus]RSK31109.1 hypothetical protein EI290_13895 [Hymenobacter metallilatus]
MLYAFALTLLLATLLTVLAFRRPDARRRALRVAAGLAAALGLGLMAFPPSHTTTIPAPSTAILLTASYSPDTLRDLLRQLGPATPVRRYGPAESADTAAVGSPAALRQQFPRLRTLHVLGQGLPPADLPELAGLRLLPHQDAPLTGFQLASWPTQPELGQAWTLEGSFRSAQPAPVWVRLYAAGAPRDSVRLPTGRGLFRLRFTPRAEGRAVYRLEARAESRLLARELVPLEVRPTRVLRVLVLAAAPSFEIRFLKNELAARQHAVALRIGLSRGLTQTELLNLPASLSLSRLSPELLARFEVVIADAGALTALSPAEGQALSQAVQRGGCGVLLLADAAAIPRSMPGGAAFRVLPRPAAASTLPMALYWLDAPRPASVVAAVLQPNAQLRPLITGPNQQLVAAGRRVGLGQVAATTVAETFPWLLQRQTAAYTAYWGHLLSAIRPAQASGPELRLLTPYPRPNEPLQLRAEGAGAGPFTVTGPTGPGTTAATQQDARIPEWATATYWPAVAGWHEARLGAARQWFYVFDSAAWHLPQQQAWYAAAQPYSMPVAGAAAGAAAGAQHTTWPRWVGLLVFLAGAGLLWLEEKL